MDLDTLKPPNQFAFNRQFENPHPGPFLGSTRDNRIEPLSDPRFEQQRSRRFSDLAFNFGGGILCCGAMSCQNIQFIYFIGY